MKTTKYFFMTLLMAILSMNTMAQGGNVLSVPDVTAQAGVEALIPIMLDNEGDVVAMEFDITLPEGFVVESNAILSNRCEDHAVVMRGIGEQTYKAMLYSPSNKPLRGNSGEVMALRVNVPEGLPTGTSYAMSLQNTVLAGADGGNVLTSVSVGMIRIGGAPDLMVKGVTPDKGRVAPGEKLVISWQVENIGESVTGGGWTEQVSLVDDSGATSKMLASTFCDQRLTPGAVVSRSVDIQLPQLVGIDGQLRVQVRIVPSDQTGEDDNALANNIAISEELVQVAKMLFVQIQPSHVTEGESQEATLMISRSGSWANEETFTISHTNDSRVQIPVTFSIPSGQSGEWVQVAIADNDVLDNDSIVTLTISGNGYEAATAKFVVEDDELPILKLTASKSVVAEGETFQLNIKLDRVSSNKVEVKLSCEQPERFEIPSSVIIPEGTANASVDVRVMDDDLPSPETSISFMAVADDYLQGDVIVILQDDDIPVIDLELQPTKVSEGGGLMAIMATLKRLSEANTKVTVILSDNSDGDIYYPNQKVVLDKGVNQLQFSLGVTNNAIVDGDRNVQITAAVYMSSCGCQATESGAGVVTKTLEIIDDDGSALSLSTSKGLILEGDEDGAVVTVTRNTDTSETLEVTLNSNCDDKLVYNHKLIIPKGETSVSVNVKANGNNLTDDTKNVVFTAEAEGFAKGVCWLMISDQTLPDAVISNLELSANEVKVDNVVELNLSVANQGNAVLEDAIPVNLYLNGMGNPLTTLYTPKQLEKGESVTLHSYILAPDTIGKFALVVKVNENQRARELSFVNNVFIGQDISVSAPYRANVKTDKDKYVVGDTIVISGSTNGYMKEDAFVEIYVISDGMRETLMASIGEGGSFVTKWVPANNQAGDFIVGACYPGQNLTEPMASFGIYGIKTDNSSFTKIDMSLSEIYEGSFVIANQGSLPLTDVKIITQSLPEGCRVEFDQIGTLSGNETKDVHFKVMASDVTAGTEWEHIKLIISSAEGAFAYKTLYYYCRPSQAVLQASIDEINTSVVKGSPREYQFTIGNRGYGSTGQITIMLPPFMKALTPSTMSSLDTGEYATVVLQMNTTDDMQINVPVTGQIAVNCADGDGLAIPYSVEPVSDIMGTLIIDVTDEFSYYTDERPHLEGADIMVKHPVTGQLLSSGKSGVDGVWSVSLPEGYYTVCIAAQKHAGYTQNIQVDPEREKKVVAFLSYNAIQYSWTVEETDVEDVYEIVNTVDFETRVPAPVVKVDFPKLPYRNQIVNVTITNEGLIHAKDIVLGQPVGNEFIRFELLGDNHIDLLKAGEMRTIPIRIYVDEDDAFPEAQMAIGTAFNIVSSSSGAVSSRSNVKGKNEGRPSCILVQMPVDMPITECDSKIGDLVVVGHKTIMANYYYGDCGMQGSPWPLIGGADFPWVSPPSSPGGSGKQGPKTTTYFADRLRTILTTGCLNDCEMGLAKTAKDCYDAYSDCKKGEFIDPSFDCAPDVANDCFGNASKLTKDLDAALDCIGSGMGCVGGCAESLFNCLRDIYDTFNACMEEYKRFKAEYGEAPAMRKTMSKDNNEGFGLMIDWNLALIERRKILMGEGDWSALEANDYGMMLGYALHGRDASGYIIMDQSRLSAKPECISLGQFDHFLERCNNTLVFERTGVYSDNMLDKQALGENNEKLADIESKAKSMGYANVKDMLTDARDYFFTLLAKAEKPATGVCSTVTLEFGQSVVMTRQAFRGTLTVYNGNDEMPMRDFKLSLELRDPDGNLATSRQFQINAESLTGFEGDLSLESGWSLGGKQTGVATILFIPTKYAAIHEPKDYSFGGVISYVDPNTGLVVRHDLNPVTLTVKPTADLDLAYFMQRDVFGDNPFTKEVEKSEPAEFALIINNKGYGDANNVRMVTSQPQIVDNKKGLLIDFELISSQINGGAASLAFGQSIANDFGTIEAHSQAYAQWWLQSSLLGHFIDYDVKATHVTSYGNENLSLLDSVAIHELIHGFTVEGGRGFLVNDIPDMNDLPDRVYFTDASINGVTMARDASVTQKGASEFLLSVASSKTGWNYGSLFDPTSGKQKLVGVTRQSDGASLPLDNVWQTSFTMPDGADPIAENLLHFVVNITGSESYLLAFEPLPDVELIIDTIIGIPADGEVSTEPLSNVIVRFNKPIMADSFNSEDVKLVCQGINLDAQVITITPVSDTDYSIDLSSLTTNDGFYVLTIQTSGITDKEGFNGLSGKTVSWIQLLTEPLTKSNCLYGTVTTLSDGAPVEGAVVTLCHNDVTFTTISDAQGRYEVRVDDTTLEYEVTCVADGFIHVKLEEVVVNEDGSSYNFLLARGATVLLPSDGVCTFSSTAALDFSQLTDKVKAYYGKRYNNQSVSMEDVAMTAPGEGLVLIGQPGLSLDIPEAEGDVMPLVDNLLTGTAYAPYMVTSDNVYVLSAKTGKNKFHRAAQGLVIPRYKAYLVMGASDTAYGVVEMVIDEATLVHLLKGEVENENHFGINGMLIERNSKGVHVLKGKKILVK